VTVQSFNEWKTRFDREAYLRKTRDEEDRLKAMSAKERDEYKKMAVRLTGRCVFPYSAVVAYPLAFPGRQLFERDKDLAASDASLLEDGTVSVDVSQYDRIATEDDDDDEDRLEFSDSD
jgi:hypothetical protein